MGEHRNSLLMNLVAGIGFLLLVAMSIYTATEKVWPAISGMRATDATDVAAAAAPVRLRKLLRFDFGIVMSSQRKT